MNNIFDENKELFDKIIAAITDSDSDVMAFIGFVSQDGRMVIMKDERLGDLKFEKVKE